MSDLESSERWTARAEAWLASRRAELLVAAGAVVSGASGLVGDATIIHFGKPGGFIDSIQWKWALLAVGAAVLLLAALASRDVQGDLASAHATNAAIEEQLVDLQAEVDQYRTAANTILSRLLEAFSDELGGTDSERINVYRHTGEGFVRMARFSRSPVFNRAGRVKYSDQAGVVGEAWAQSKASRFLDDAECVDRRTWERTVRPEMAISAAEAKNLRMQSRSLVACRIEDDVRRKACAVLVFESTRPRSELDQLEFGHQCDISTHLRCVMAGRLGESLSQSIGILSRLAPAADPDVALREGF